MSITERSTDHSQQIAREARDTHLPSWRLFHWIGPHIVIWASVTATVWFAAARTDCTGFCAIYSGVFGYLLLTVAAVLSAVIGIVQILFLSRDAEDGLTES